MLSKTRRLIWIVGVLALCACDAASPSPPIPLTEPSPGNAPGIDARQETDMWMTVGEHRFAITLTDNASARAFATQLPLTLDMSELNGNEKHADLPKALPTNASRAGTIRNGDLMLYGTDTLVVFYAMFSSSYSYTRIGRVDDSNGLVEALGRRGVRVTFSRD